MSYARFAGRLHKLEAQAHASFEADLKALSDAELAALVGPDVLTYLDALAPEELRLLAEGGLEEAHRGVEGYRRWARGRR